MLDDPKLNFSAAHFLIEHDKCSRIHGHNYYIKIEILGDLDENSMIIDFLEVKKLILKNIEHLDHRLLLPVENPHLEIRENGNNLDIKVLKTEKIYSFPREDVARIPVKATTAECIAEYIHSLLKKELSGLKFCIAINENTGSHAVYGDF